MIRRIALNEIGYPERLKNIHKPPKEIYINGSILPQDEFAIAIVGSRRASIYGIQMSEKFAYELAFKGVTIVSGMARGIDTAAHRGALKAGGRTIAVMGSGHKYIYPPENKKLYGEIAASGAVITELKDDVAPLPYNFPLRNRIISALSLGVLVVEAAKDSGALITAEFAAEQGREVFALPGKISSGTSAGTNALIKDGAKLVQSVEDILEELNLRDVNRADERRSAGADNEVARMARAYVYNSLSADERGVFKVLSDEPMHIDEIGIMNGMDRAAISRVLLSLQIKKVIKELPGKNYVRKEM